MFNVLWAHYRVFQYNEDKNEESLENYEIKKLQRRIAELKKIFGVK